MRLSSCLSPLFGGAGNLRIRNYVARAAIDREIEVLRFHRMQYVAAHHLVDRSLRPYHFAVGRVVLHQQNIAGRIVVVRLVVNDGSFGQMNGLGQLVLLLPAAAFPAAGRSRRRSLTTSCPGHLRRGLREM